MEIELRTLIKSATSATVTWGWGKVSETSSYPLVTLVQISQNINYTYDGDDNLHRSRVQVDIWAKDQTSAMAIRNALVPVFNGTKLGGNIKNIFIEDIQSGREESVSRVIMDIIVWHS